MKHEIITIEATHRIPSNYANYSSGEKFDKDKIIDQKIALDLFREMKENDLIRYEILKGATVKGSDRPVDFVSVIIKVIKKEPFFPLKILMEDLSK